MLLLINKAYKSIADRYRPGLGRLVQPRNWSTLPQTDALMPWAADNDAFNGGVDPEKFRRMLTAIDAAPKRRLLFTTAPDVVGDDVATLDAFIDWHKEIPGPVALVLQDGMTPSLPWGHIDAVFIGGSTEWKLGADAAEIVAEGNRRGKWTHMGRVNTRRRIRYAKSIGCKSVDGTALSMFTDTYLEAHHEEAQAPTQGRLIA